MDISSLYSSSTSVAGAMLVGSLLYLFASIFYSLCFHPLSKFKGPLLWRAFRFPFVVALISGDLPHRIKNLHSQYGHVVRVGPDELSFTDPAAWKDIYAKNFRRAPQYSNKPPGKNADNLISANESAHARFRKVLAPAFSEKFIHEHEHKTRGRVNLLMQELSRLVESEKSANIDLLKWYNYTTLDIISEFIWSSSFGCLDEDRYPPWLQIINQFKVAMFKVASRYYSPADMILNLLTPKRAFAPLIQTWRNIEEKLSQRLEMRAHRVDLVSVVGAANEISDTSADQASDTYMSRAEIESNILSLLVAGSDSVTTVLTGCTNYILREPTVLEELVREIRSTFQDETQITGPSLARLPYLNAVLQESMRLCPTVPDGMRRIVPKGGANVAGNFLPENVVVSVPQWATYQSESNFKSPSFCPQRWLSESSQSSSPYRADRKDAFNPFSLGSRSCPGRALAFLEMRLILAKLVWNFDMTKSVDTELPEWEKQRIYWFWVKQPVYVNLKNAQVTKH